MLEDISRIFKPLTDRRKKGTINLMAKKEKIKGNRS